MCRTGAAIVSVLVLKSTLFLQTDENDTGSAAPPILCGVAAAMAVGGDHVGCGSAAEGHPRGKAALSIKRTRVDQCGAIGNGCSTRRADLVHIRRQRFSQDLLDLDRVTTPDRAVDLVRQADVT